MAENDHDVFDHQISNDELKALEKLRFSLGFRHHCFHPDNGLTFQEFNQREEERLANYIAERRAAFYAAQQAQQASIESDVEEQA